MIPSVSSHTVNMQYIANLGDLGSMHTVYTIVIVSIEYHYLSFLPIHTFYTVFLLGWSTHPRVAELYERCLQGGQAWTYLMNTENTMHDQHHTHTHKYISNV